MCWRTLGYDDDHHDSFLDGGGKKEDFFFRKWHHTLHCAGYLCMYICKGEKYREKAAKGEKTRRED